MVYDQAKVFGFQNRDNFAIVLQDFQNSQINTIVKPFVAQDTGVLFFVEFGERNFLTKKSEWHISYLRNWDNAVIVTLHSQLKYLSHLRNIVGIVGQPSEEWSNADTLIFRSKNHENEWLKKYDKRNKTLLNFSEHTYGDLIERITKTS